MPFDIKDGFNAIERYGVDDKELNRFYNSLQPPSGWVSYHVPSDIKDGSDTTERYGVDNKKLSRFYNPLGLSLLPETI